jgi:glutathione S-transferase
VFESGAILMYLAEKTGKFMPKDMAKKYDVIQWLMVQVSGVGPAFGNFTHFNLFAPKPQRVFVQPLQERDAAALRLLDKRLGQTKYLGGDEYSIADMATFPWTRQHQAHGAKIDEQAEPQALVRGTLGAAGGQGDGGQAGRHQVEPRDRDRRQQGPLLQPRQVRQRA